MGFEELGYPASERSYTLSMRPPRQAADLWPGILRNFELAREAARLPKGQNGAASATVPDPQNQSAERCAVTFCPPFHSIIRFAAHLAASVAHNSEIVGSFQYVSSPGEV
jgi:hypothetical protein